MKLLMCPHCHDVRKLGSKQIKTAADLAGNATHCECGKSWGYYVNDIFAEYGGDAILIGINNESLAKAVALNRKHGGTRRGDGRLKGRRFEAFIIPDDAPTVKRKE